MFHLTIHLLEGAIELLGRVVLQHFDILPDAAEVRLSMPVHRIIGVVAHILVEHQVLGRHVHLAGPLDGYVVALDHYVVVGLWVAIVLELAAYLVFQELCVVTLLEPIVL